MSARVTPPIITVSHAAVSAATRVRLLPRARGGGAGALARARRLPGVGPPPPGCRAVGVLRGPADRQRPPGIPPRARPRLQGRLPALPDDARPLRRAQGRL